MTLPATDNFTGTNGTNLTTYSANWSYVYGANTFQIYNNGLRSTASSDSSQARWNADTFDDDQYSEIYIAAIASGYYLGAMVRASSSTTNCYYFEVDSGDASYLWKVVSNTVTQLGSTAGVAAAGQTWRIEAEGTTIRVLKNGSTSGTPGAQTDSSISSGYAGVHAWNGATSTYLDNWEGGNLGAAAQNITPGGIASAAAFGSATVSVAASDQTISPTGIASAEAFGSATVTAPVPGQTITPTGVASAAAFGTAVLLPGAVTIAPAGIASAFATGLTELLMAACIGGALRVSTANSRYFENDSGLLVLSGTWWWHTVQDGEDTDPPAATDWPAYLAYTKARGGNLIKHSMQESPRNWPDVYPYYYQPLPWARTGPGNAADGEPKFDLTSWDTDYFERLRARTIEAGNAGMYVVVQLAQGWQIDNKGLGTGSPWSYHPMHPSNNINSVDGDLNDDGVGNDTRDSSNTTIFNHWKALYEKMYEVVGDLDNVLWEISNEDGTYSRQWQWDFIDYIHGYEATGGRKEHATGMTWIWPGGDNEDDLDASPADWVSYGANDTSPLSNPPAWPPTAGATGKVSVWDTDHMGGIVYDIRFMWRSFTRGHNPLWMDKYDGTLYGGDIRSDADSERIRYNMGYIQSYAAQLDLANVTPQGSLASTGYCLAKLTGQAQLLAYQPGSGNFTIDLSSVSGTFSLEWLRPSTGATQAGSNVSGGAVRTLTPPWASEDVVAFLELTELTISPSGIASGAAFGTATIVPGAIVISCTGIASAEAFGSASTQPGAVTVAPSGVTSAEAFGTAALQPGAVTVSPSGVATAEAFGTALVQAGESYIAPTGIASAEAYGDAAVQPGAVSIVPTGIASGETHGETLLATGAVLQPTGIASGEAHGATTVQPGAVSIVADGIATAEGFGTAALLVDLLVAAAGIATGEAFGTALLSVGGAFIQPAGIDSGETFGDLVVQPGAVSILPAGIAGGESFGTLRLVVAGADQYIDVPSVQAGEQFGIATLLMALIAERTLSVRAESRRYVVSAENRTYSVTR